MPLSSDPVRRRRQLANLRKGGPRPVGKARALKHGGTASARFLPVAGKARAIYDRLAEDAPLRAANGELPNEDRTAVELFALCLARLESVANYVELHGLLDERGNVRPAVNLERLLRQEAADHADALGLSPRSRVRLGLELVQAETAGQRLESHLAQRYGDGNGEVVEDG